jgi:hypothetical protein
MNSNELDAALDTFRVMLPVLRKAIPDDDAFRAAFAQMASDIQDKAGSIDTEHVCYRLDSMRLEYALINTLPSASAKPPADDETR